jgi:hypothetical protein
LLCDSGARQLYRRHEYTRELPSLPQLVLHLCPLKIAEDQDLFALNFDLA